LRSSSHRSGLGAALLLALTPTLPADIFVSPEIESSEVFNTQWIRDTDLFIRRASPKIGDVNGDGDLEVVIGTLGGMLHVLDPETGADLPGWPLDLGAPIDRSAAIGDVDGDHENEIVVVTGVNDNGQNMAGSWSNESNGIIFVFEGDGTEILRMPSRDWLHNADAGIVGSDGFSEMFLGNPALGDLDGDGAMEIVAGAADHFIYGINATGGAFETSADGLVLQFNASAEHPATNSIYSLDEDNDGRWDEDPPGDTTPWPFGDGVPGFPGEDDDGDGQTDEPYAHPNDDDEDSDEGTFTVLSQVDEDSWQWPMLTPDTVWGSAAIADLNGDGALDVAIAGDHMGPTTGALIHAVDFTSQLLTGWGGSLEDRVLPALIWTPISIGDVDEDGSPELFAGTNQWYTPEPGVDAWGGGFIYGFNHDGTEIRDGDGEPDTRGVFAVTRDRPPNPAPGRAPFVFGAPALGDIDGDGETEIVACDNYFLTDNDPHGGLHAWEADGSPVAGFPIESPDARIDWGGVHGGPVLADIDGDGDIEILFATVASHFVAYHHDGTLMRGTPFFAIDREDGAGPQWMGNFLNTPAVGDIDNDGMVEIVIASTNHFSTDQNPNPGIGRIICIEAGEYDPFGMEWPQEAADAQSAGVQPDPRGTHHPGDVNGDDRVDAADLVRLLLALSGEHPLALGTHMRRNALITPDLVIDESDLDALLQILLNDI
jgi:hypothetical protein